MRFSRWTWSEWRRSSRRITWTFEHWPPCCCSSSPFIRIPLFRLHRYISTFYFFRYRKYNEIIYKTFWKYPIKCSRTIQIVTFYGASRKKSKNKNCRKHSWKKSTRRSRWKSPRRTVIWCLPSLPKTTPGGGGLRAGLFERRKSNLSLYSFSKYRILY